MAIGATFTASFEDFKRQVADAVVTVKDFSRTNKQVEGDLTRLASSFSGAKIQKDALLTAKAVESIGGASRLTAAEQRRVTASIDEALEKYRALGQGAPAEIIKIRGELQSLSDQSAAAAALQAKLSGTTDQVAASNAQASLSVKDLVTGYVAGIATWETAKAALGGVVRFISSSIDEYAEAERATKRLTVALVNQGQATPETIAGLADLSDEYQRTTRFSGTLLTETQALFTQIGEVAPEQMDIALTAATNLAEGLGVDLERASMAVAKALQGQEGALKKLAPSLDEAALKGGDLATIAAEINQHFGGAAAAQLDTYQGRLDQLANSWDDVKQAIGHAIVEDDLVRASLRATAQAARGTADATTELTATQLAGTFALRANEKSIGTVLLALDLWAKQANATADAQALLNRTVAEFDRGGLTGGGLAQFNKGTALPTLTADGMQEWERQNTALDEAKKRAEATAKAFASLRAEISGTSTIEDLRKLHRVWLDLTPAEQAHAMALGTIVDRVSALADVLPEVPPELQAFAREMQAASAQTLKFDAAIKKTFGSGSGFEDFRADLDRVLGRVSESLKAEHASIAETTKLREQADREWRKLTMDRTAFEIGEIERWVNAQARGLDESVDAWTARYTEIERVAGTKMAAIIMDTDAWRLAMIQLGTVFPPLLAYIDELDEKMGGAAASGKKFGEVFSENLQRSLQRVPSIVSDAFIHGASVEDTAAAVATEIGAGIGASIGFAIGGPMGAAIGEALGSLLGPLVETLIKTRAERTVERVAREFGVSISEDLAQGIEDEAKRQFGGNRQAAKIFHLDDIIREGGGLSAGNYRLLMGRLRDVYSMVETGAFTAAQAQEVLNDNFSTFAEFVTRDGGRITRELQDIIRLNDQLGTESAAIAEFTSGQARRALDQIGGFITQRGALVDELVDAERRLADLTRDASRGADPKVLAQTRDEIAKLQRQLSAMPLTEGGAQAVGASLFGVVDRLVRNGEAPLEVLRQVDPLIASLDRQLAQAGLTGGAAFDRIRAMAGLATDEIAGPALTAISQLGGSLDSLHNADILNPEIFLGLTDQIGGTIDALIGQGKTFEELGPLVRRELQTIWELQQDFGYAVGDSTQAWLDQAEAAGMVGDQHRSVQERQIQLMERQTLLLEGIAEVFGVVLPAEVEKFAAAIDALPTDIDVKGQVTWDVDDIPVPDGVPYHLTSGEGGPMTEHDEGAYIRRDHVARVHAGELIGPVDFMSKAIEGALRRGGPSAGASADLDYAALAQAVTTGVINALHGTGLSDLGSGPGRQAAVERHVWSDYPRAQTHNVGGIRDANRTLMRQEAHR